MLYLHICPRTSTNGVVLYSAVIFEKEGVPPSKIFVHETKKHPNQFINVLRNIKFGLESCYELYQMGDLIDQQICIVTNNQTVVTWFKKRSAPATYIEDFEILFSIMEMLPIRTLAITSDKLCLAKKYAIKSNITSSDLTEEDIAEETFVSFTTILNRD